MKKLARRQTEDNQSGDRDKKTTGNGKNKKKKDDEAGLNGSLMKYFRFSRKLLI